MLELMLAISIFLISIFFLLLILDSLALSRLGREITIATFLAQEGLEAVKSIRDNNFDDLATGTHGLAISEGHWVFQGTEEDLSYILREGRRIIEIEEIDPNRKRVSSRVFWQFNDLGTQEIILVTYFTNW